MATQLIMTVGENPLPVWVAWSHLKQQLDPPVEVRFVHTQKTVNEMNRLKQYCSGASVLSPIQTSPGDPEVVRRDVHQVLNSLNNFTHLHVHYTGGTKVMSVETVAEIEYGISNNNIDYNTSYLDPRGNVGPTIVDSHGLAYTPSDARMDINVDLNIIGLLNGFTLAPFVHEYWDDSCDCYTKVDKPAPATLDSGQERRGTIVLGDMAAGNRGGIRSIDFEYAAYVALIQALAGIKSRNTARSNYKIYHNVYVRRTGAKQRDGIFELDVVALLGYQIVVVSCTLETRYPAIKQKGLEVIHRVNQLGGSEAQAIVLCQGHPNTAQRVQKDLVGAPIKVWGTDKWSRLQNEFGNYLQTDLHWQ